MPSYQIKNLDTGNVLEMRTDRGLNNDTFADSVNDARKWAKQLGQRIAIMGLPFIDNTPAGREFTSELFVAYP